jgi:hypothetical protein
VKKRLNFLVGGVFVCSFLRVICTGVPLCLVEENSLFHHQPKKKVDDLLLFEFISSDTLHQDNTFPNQ